MFCLVSYSRKVWREESLANLANEWHFAKLKFAKSFYTVQIYLAIDKFAKFSLAKIVLPKFPPAKLSCYTLCNFVNYSFNEIH